MAAIGDADGTISIMQLCRPLYESANKDKEVMATIFDRELRREKYLEVMKKTEKTEKAPPKRTIDPARV